MIIYSYLPKMVNYGLNVCVPPESYVEVLTPKVTIFGDGGLWEVIRFG